MENPMNEDQLQAMCFKWFDETFPAERKMLFAVPNGGLRPKTLIKGKWIDKEGNKLKAMGLQPGVSDTIFVTDEVSFLEFKFGDGVQSDDQLDFEYKVSVRGHTYLVIKSLVEFQTIIKSKLARYERSRI